MPSRRIRSFLLFLCKWPKKMITRSHYFNHNSTSPRSLEEPPDSVESHESTRTLPKLNTVTNFTADMSRVTHLTVTRHTFQLTVIGINDCAAPETRLAEPEGQESYFPGSVHSPTTRRKVVDMVLHRIKPARSCRIPQIFEPDEILAVFGSPPAGRFRRLRLQRGTNLHIRSPPNHSRWLCHRTVGVMLQTLLGAAECDPVSPAQSSSERSSPGNSVAMCSAGTGVV